MTGERLGIAEIDQPFEERERIVESRARVVAANREGQQRTGAATEILLHQRIVWIFREADVADRVYALIGSQEFCNEPRILHVPLDSQGHGFYALPQQEGAQ